MLNKEKIMFITGGVISSLGKGIIASSLGRLFEDGGVSVGMMKCDPYLNIDPGTMSPIEHGEVFVTADGGETDLDLGHYERFLNKNLSKESSLTSGRIYQEILTKEREGFYKGKTVQVIPHVTNLIKEKIYTVAKKYDLLIVEVGGSVGDIESLAYTEAIRQIKYELQKNASVIHVGYIPFIKVSKELKTKPMQRSINLLRSLGVSPNFLVTRSEIKLNKKELEKISMFSNMNISRIFQCIDVSSIYNIPFLLKEQKFDKNIAKYMNINIKESNHFELKEFNENLTKINKKVNIAIVGKYTENPDSYLSVIEALKHASVKNKFKLNYKLINSKKNYDINILKKFDGIIIPGGFGNSGVDGIMKAIKFARVNNIPFLGICFGMQLSILEFAKNVLKINVVHGELNPESPNKIIDIINETKDKLLGGSMRLGNYECFLRDKTLTKNIYGLKSVFERHRHRYELNNKYVKILESKGMIISGIHPKNKLAEIIENINNDFFIATQFHPELSSKITKPHKLFISFIKASTKHK
ncbi:MAG: CTP synthase [Mycoplasmataceae bacterium]|nr:CTP synthase [Mycoplasmataceae bacterium]